mgnify:CR=1 FL=1
MQNPRTKWLAVWLALALAQVLSGCATVRTEGGVPIDTHYTAQGQDSRVMFLIIHYTVANFPLSLKILTERQVSAHYLLSDESPPRIYRLVDERRRAWHSGASAWQRIEAAGKGENRAGQGQDANRTGKQHRCGSAAATSCLIALRLAHRACSLR